MEMLTDLFQAIGLFVIFWFVMNRFFKYMDK